MTAIEEQRQQIDALTRRVDALEASPSIEARLNAIEKRLDMDHGGGKP